MKRTVVLPWAGAAAGTTAATLVVLPDLLGLDTRIPFAQLVALRPPLLAALLLLLVPVLVTTRRRRGVRPVAAGLLIVAVAGSALVVPRVLPEPAPDGGRPLTVLALNVHGGAADPEQLAALIRAEHPDLVALPEAGPRYAARLAPLAPGYRMHVAGDGRDVDGVTALTADRLGDVHMAVGNEMRFFPTVELTGGGLGSLRLVAAHTAAPVPDLMIGWVADLRVLRTWCGSGEPVVVAGDLNATLDHSALRAGSAGCADAADQLGAGLVSTWGPGARTRPFGPQIDHVLVGGGVAAETFAVHDIAGTDHRAVVSRLRVL